MSRPQRHAWKEENQLVTGKDNSLEICLSLVLPALHPVPSHPKGPYSGSLFPSLTALAECSPAVASFGLSQLPLFVYLFRCQPLSLAVVVNRARDCQLWGLCSEPFHMGDSSRRLSILTGRLVTLHAQKRLQAGAQTPDHPNGTLQTERSITRHVLSIPS